MTGTGVADQVLPRSPGFRLEGRSALVTGGSRGIGLAAAAALVEAGADVTIVARSAADVRQAVELLGAKASGDAFDICDRDAFENFLNGRPTFDILVNNAGTNRPKPMYDVTEEEFDAVMTLNVRASFFVAQACVKRMIAAGAPGSLIHISSQMGHVGGPNRSLYCASKWALEGMNKAFALDLAQHGIRSNTIAPTFIETPLTRPYFEDEAFRRSVIDKIKLGRLGRVEDIMGAVVFLASEASALITGTSILIDGGWTAD